MHGIVKKQICKQKNTGTPMYIEGMMKKVQEFGKSKYTAVVWKQQTTHCGQYFAIK